MIYIKNTSCTYQKEIVVLTIDEMEILVGDLVFVIGKSGIGKSTLIESLGLMNKTFQVKNNGYTLYKHEDKETDLNLLWKNIQDVSEFRQKNYSFLFQENNLLTHFTAGENMMMGQLIKGISKGEAQEYVYKLMEALNLERSVFEAKVFNLSGGQRQRVAFIRAISAPFNVLFADEPTGNLDNNTARKLFSILKSELKNKKQSGIIVSHDIHLALQFGTNIYPIKSNENQKDSNGYTDKTLSIKKEGNDWVNINGDKIIDPVNYLNEFLN